MIPLGTSSSLSLLELRAEKLLRGSQGRVTGRGAWIRVNPVAIPVGEILRLVRLEFINGKTSLKRKYIT